ncbi:gliding motility lipoprotein GldB [Salegentibacter echinorum]|nr:gliding motility lipoprotein GldB [Salegentibacter echinorum]
MYKRIFLMLAVCTLWSCNEEAKIEKEIAAIPMDFQLVRFDKKFAAATPQNLAKLQEEYPFMFPAQFPDSLWVKKLNDTIQQELETEVQKAFPTFENEKTGLKKLFQHIKYYFPAFEAPRVITVTSEVDYKNKVILSEDYLFLSLDTYLGKEHRFYIGIQEFLKKNFRKEQLLPDVANAYAEKYTPRAQSRTFLSRMIYFGKLLFLKDKFIPEVDDREKIGYTKDELDWVKNNEAQIWRYFVENETLFDTDNKLNSRFLYPGPFSKFRLELDAESPARVGQYIGWQIVRKYMEEREISLQQLLKTDAETIFNNANYKPKK